MSNELEKRDLEGGSAFPVSDENILIYGMTLRDYFAARAMEALLDPNSFPPPADIAAIAYRQADAMITARGH